MNMEAQARAEVLKLLDRERQTIIYPGVTRSTDVNVVRDVSDDGRRCEIVFSACSEEEVVQIIGREARAARNERYELEWKVYGHDRPHCLAERLAAAGWEAGEREAFMVLLANEKALERFEVRSGDVRRVTTRKDLEDYRRVREEVNGRGCDRDIEQYAYLLQNHPGSMSVYVGYVDGEPAACGRVHFHGDSSFGALCGGQTRQRFRRRGLFTRLVATRVREALSRGVRYVCVDALPTSEPILAKHGFERLTYTQPFCLPIQSVQA